MIKPIEPKKKMESQPWFVLFYFLHESKKERIVYSNSFNKVPH